MRPLRVLVACEYSGRVRDAFRALGHDAMSCDLLPTEADGPHHQGDVRELLEPGRWDLMIAHPPCTYLATSGMRWTASGARDPQLTEDALEFVRLLMAAPVPRIAIENPKSVISGRIRRPDQIIQPYQFGHDASKTTCLWLKGLPHLMPVGRPVPPRMVNGLPRWANQAASGADRTGPGPDRWKERSRTYQGIADAMASQWGRQRMAPRQIDLLEAA